MRKKIQAKQIPNSVIKNTYWPTWINEVELPNFIDGDILDNIFATEIKEVKKHERKNSDVNINPKKQLIVLLDDKRSRNLSIILSRFPISSTDIVRILDEYELNGLQISKTS